MVAGIDDAEPVGHLGQLFLALDVQPQVAVGAEEVDGSLLLHRIPRKQHSLVPVGKGHAAVGVAGNLDDLQPVVPAGEGIPFPQGVQPGGPVHQVPVLLMQPGFGKFLQASGVVGVAVGQQHLHRGVGEAPHRLQHLTARKTGVQQQGLVRGGEKKLPYHSIVQHVQIIRQRLCLQHGNPSLSAQGGRSLHLRPNALYCEKGLP